MNRTRPILTSLLVGVVGLSALPVMALTIAPQIAQDQDSGYDRLLFKHWIGVDL